MLKALPPEIVVPDAGFEGWFYKKVPGGYFFKKTLLIGIIVALFALSLILFSLGRFNLREEDAGFQERAQQTNI